MVPDPIKSDGAADAPPAIRASKDMATERQPQYAKTEVATRELDRPKEMAFVHLEQNKNITSHAQAVFDLITPPAACATYGNGGAPCRLCGQDRP
jgi:hypothetical protein